MRVSSPTESYGDEDTVFLNVVNKPLLHNSAFGRFTAVTGRRVLEIKG